MNRQARYLATCTSVKTTTWLAKFLGVRETPLTTGGLLTNGRN